MKRGMLLILLCVGAVLAPQVHAEDRPLGVITSTGTSKNNFTTASAFVIPAGHPLAVQCDAAAWVIASTRGNAAFAASTFGEKVQTDQWWPLGARNSAVNAVAVISVSGTANCQVFDLYDGR